MLMLIYNGRLKMNIKIYIRIRIVYRQCLLLGHVRRTTELSVVYYTVCSTHTHMYVCVCVCMCCGIRSISNVPMHRGTFGLFNLINIYSRLVICPIEDKHVTYNQQWVPRSLCVEFI